ncbi:hypothetical protein, conserved [Eimeria maxima]|uniref:Uncharacterized protein n=1 Tax=Eimeria maxima TaxID=5804 RepID=U6MBC6_EIMMA|nr:hypothetical protein, conserved [Eimeria maxima]CDJ59774.1 hypothetical protein, conserved [Eimeria maxima]
MRLALVPIAFVLSTLTTNHVKPVHSKILSASMLSGMLFGTSAPEATAPASIAATVDGASGSDAPSSGDQVSASATSGSAADLTPKADIVRELAEQTQQADSGAPGQEVLASQSDAQATKAEVKTEQIVAAATENAVPTASNAIPAETKTPAANREKQQLTEEDAAKNSELLQSVSESAEASWISKVSKESAIEALLPLVALTPVLAAAGFHADIDESTPGSPLVRFPSIDYAVRVEDLKSYD